MPQALLTACRLFDSLSIISLRRSFVKRFFLTFSSFYFLFLHLLGLRDTALSSVHIFYHFLPSLSTLFCLFLPSYPQLRCFAHFLSLFFALFCMCVFIPVFCRFSTAFFHIYTYTYATLFDYHILGLPMFLMLFLCILLVFGRKRITFFKVRLCIFAFRNRKDGQKIFAAQTPQRKRGFLSTHQTIVGEIFPHLRHLLSSLADAPHCSMMGSVQILTLAKARAIFYIVLQSTGHTFPTSSLSRDDYV